MRFLAALVLVGCGRLGFEAAIVPADAPAVTPDVAQTFCQRQDADLCVDFDDGTTTNWVDGGATNGSYAVEGGELRSTIDPLATSTDIGEGFILHQFTTPATRITLGVDVRIDQIGQGDAVIAQIRFSGAQRHGIEYVYRAAGSYVEEFRDTTFDVYPIAGAALSLGQRHRLELDMDLRATPHMKVRQDGVMVLDTDLIGNMTGNARSTVGIVFLRGPSTAWTIHSDNLVVDVE